MSSKTKKNVFKIFISHQNKFEETINKNSETDGFEILGMCDYPVNKLAVLFVVAVDEKPNKVIPKTSKIRLFSDNPKKVQIDMNNVAIESVISIVSTGKFINVLCVASDIKKDEPVEIEV